MPDSPAQLVARLQRRDRRALARLLTLAEQGSAPAPPPAVSRPYVVGIAGSGGAGKSTLVGALVAHLRALGKRVAVLACDPASPLTGGALLGDRIRVKIDPGDEDVYFRSFSTRGAQGGISRGAAAALPWLAAYGFDVVLIETVGVGQDQVAIREIVQTLALLVTPHTGDEVQWEKAGLIEVADLVVVNKSDLPGADRVRQQLLAALTLSPNKQPPPILNVTAATGAGIGELWNTLAAMANPKAPPT